MVEHVRSPRISNCNANSSSKSLSQRRHSSIQRNDKTVKCRANAWTTFDESAQTNGIVESSVIKCVVLSSISSE